jgi:hypothetical protein
MAADMEALFELFEFLCVDVLQVSRGFQFPRAFIFRKPSRSLIGTICKRRSVLTKVCSNEGLC